MKPVYLRLCIIFFISKIKPLDTCTQLSERGSRSGPRKQLLSIPEKAEKNTHISTAQVGNVQDSALLYQYYLVSDIKPVLQCMCMWIEPQPHACSAGMLTITPLMLQRKSDSNF